MKIGIQISSDLEKRTGVEEYIFQLLKHLPGVDDYKNHQFFVLSRDNLKWPFRIGWTQIRLSWELLRKKLDILFIPSHTFPLIYPVKSCFAGISPLAKLFNRVNPKLVIAIQGLEYEKVPKYYSWLQRKKLRFLTKRNAKKAKKIIVPSECTKKDLIKFYKINPKKIFVIHHGVIQNAKIKMQNDKLKFKNYILYLGSAHKRKNVEGLKKAYDILKKKYKVSHKLVLAGVDKYVNSKEKQQLLKNADVFVFPSFYEGFGFPVLEAQKAGVPVVASNVSSLPEILGDSALLINPKNPNEIAEAIYKVVSSEELRRELIKRGQENVKRFSWPKCAEKTLKIICG